MPDCVLDATQLAQMVPDMDDVETPPLIGAKRAKDEVAGDPLQPEAMPAGFNEPVHLIDLLAEKFEELGSAHGRPVQLIGAGKEGSGRATGHVAEVQYGHLEDPLCWGAVR